MLVVSETPSPEESINPLLQQSLQIKPSERAGAATLLSYVRQQANRCIWSSRLPATAHFTGRDDWLHHIQDGFEILRETVGAERSIVLHGLPGIGKSALAARYVSRFGDFFGSVVYLSCPLLVGSFTPKALAAVTHENFDLFLSETHMDELSFWESWLARHSDCSS